MASDPGNLDSRFDVLNASTSLSFEADIIEKFTQGDSCVLLRLDKEQVIFSEQQ